MSTSFPESCRVLVSGITSIHGWPIFQKLSSLLPTSRLYGIAPPKTLLPGWNNVGAFCITDTQSLVRVKEEFAPDIIVHCAGVCDLDLCEARPDFADLINVVGTQNMIDVFGLNIPILYLSSDLVFSGNNPPHGGYTEEHKPDPVSVVGKTMLKAEEIIMKCRSQCIVRLGLPLGDSIGGDKGAIDWIEGRFKRNLPASLFYDEYRSCITCTEIGDICASILLKGLTGLYHLGGLKAWSLYDIGKWIIQNKGYAPELLQGRLRCEEKNGPPRVGDISLNSSKLRKVLELN